MCAGLVMREPLLLVIGGAALGFLLITLLSLIWYLKRRVSATSHTSASHARNQPHNITRGCSEDANLQEH